MTTPIDWTAPTVPPAEGSLWKHHSGREYRVLFIANNVPDPKPDYPPTVVYEGLANGKRWAGRLDDWHRRMSPIAVVEDAEAAGSEQEQNEVFRDAMLYGTGVFSRGKRVAPVDFLAEPTPAASAGAGLADLSLTSLLRMTREDAAREVPVASADEIKLAVEALRVYADSCDATDTRPCGYEGNQCCMTARRALAALTALHAASGGDGVPALQPSPAAQEAGREEAEALVERLRHRALARISLKTARAQDYTDAHLDRGAAAFIARHHLGEK